MLNYPNITVLALDGKHYSTDMGGFHEQILPSNGMTVWTKLLNIGTGAKLIAISNEEAIRKGINQLYTTSEGKAASKRVDLKRKSTVVDDDYFEKHPNLREENDLRDRVRSDFMSGNGSARPKSFVRPAYNEEATPTRKPVTPKQDRPSMKDLIREEAKTFSDKKNS